MKLAIGWMISLRYTSSHACLLHRPSSLLSPCSRQSPWRPYNYFVFSLSQCSAVLLPSLLFKSLLHYYILLSIISLYHHFYKRLFKQDFLSNSSQACFWSVLMCLWLVWNDLIWSHCRIAINLVMQCTILYWCFEHFKPWNQILWKPNFIMWSCYFRHCMYHRFTVLCIQHTDGSSHFYRFTLPGLEYVWQPCFKIEVLLNS